jgi:thiol-disulfide isomerase/thioredoxin
MVSKASVVTPERYASGYTYQDYFDQVIKVNKNWFQQLYDSCQVSAEDTEFFRQAIQHPRGPHHMMVIGEDWCPDVFRGMPVMARIAEAADMEIRIFPRDANMDIMNEFLKEGQWASIPAVVFYTTKHEYICHWIERPVSADKEMKEVQAQLQKEMPNASDPEIRAAARTQNQTRYPAWQQESIREIREMLSQHMGS